MIFLIFPKWRCVWRLCGQNRIPVCRWLYFTLLVKQVKKRQTKQVKFYHFCFVRKSRLCSVLVMSRAGTVSCRILGIWPAHRRDGADYHRCRNHNQEKTPLLYIVCVRGKKRDWLCYTEFRLQKNWKKKKTVFLLHFTRLSIQLHFNLSPSLHCLFYFLLLVRLLCYFYSVDR